MDTGTRYKRFHDGLKGNVRQREKLAPYTTFRTGGEADLFVVADKPELLAQAIRLAGELDIPYFIMGGGSNLLVSDTGFRGLIIRNCIRHLRVQDNRVIAGAGEELDRVVDFATENSLAGFEFAAGIWGTLGGAIYGNAGAFGSDVGSLLAWAELVDAKGDIRTETKDYFEFTYRHSSLKGTKEIVTQAGFDLEPGNREEIAGKTEEIRQVRRRKHPVSPCSAGCFFKNVEDSSSPHGKLPAGRLLEEVGAKQMVVGDAAVFDKHANIIFNKGRATSKDIRRLADKLKEKVRERFGIILEEEVISLGDF